MSEPNLNSVWIALIQMIGTAFAVYIGYRQMRKGQDPKIDRIETLVNGDRAAKEQRIKDLEAKLRENGISE